VTVTTDKTSPKQDRHTDGPVPLAIVGIGCMFPQAPSLQTYWSNIKNGVDTISAVPKTHWQPQDYFDADPATPDKTFARRGGFLDHVDFDPLRYGISPNNIEATDTTQLLGLMVADQALLDAGYETGQGAGDGRPFDRDRASVILGVTGTLELVIPLGARLGHPIWQKALRDAGIDQATAQDVVDRIADAYVPWQENSFPGLLGNVAAGRIANRLDLGGTNCVVDAACASSLSAIHMAAMELYARRSDLVITGGLDTFNDIFMYMCFSKTPALSQTGDSRPFSQSADGTILGEGLGAIVLKRLPDAQRDGDRVYAVIRGMGSSSDGRVGAVYAPSANGQAKSLRKAYHESHVIAASIELVEAHGTGTKVGDTVEATALAKVYREAKPQGTWCAVGSVKSMIGHTKAAAGIAGIIKAAMALNHKVLPPTLKVDAPIEPLEPGESPIYLNTELRPWLPTVDHPRRAAVSAFGFGGSNFHCVLEELENQDPHKISNAGIDWDDRVLILPLSAKTHSGLQDQIHEAIECNRKATATLDKAEQRQWPEPLCALAAKQCQRFDPAASCRLILVLEWGKTDIASLADQAEQFLQKQPEANHWSTPNGAFFASGDTLGLLAVLFPGQGVQRVGMLRDLACQFPQMLDSLTAANTAFGVTEHGHRLSDHLYPTPVFTDTARTANEQRLRDTRVAQPAIGAVSLGAWRVLEHFGVKADVAAGHSFGELVALAAAGVFDENTFHHLAKERGRFMADASGDRANVNANAGAMLVVHAPIDQVRQWLGLRKLELTVANHNAPNQTVLSGASDAIDQAITGLMNDGFRAQKLPVSAAFHSPRVAGAQKRFQGAVDPVDWRCDAKVTVFANSTAKPYPTTAKKSKQLLAGQIARPIEFVQEIENMYTRGVRTFLEVGPGHTLGSLVRAILEPRPHHTISIDASRGKRSGTYDLACAIAQLAVNGHKLDLGRWNGGEKRFSDDSPNALTAKKPKVTVRLNGANYFKPSVQHQPKAKNDQPTTRWTPLNQTPQETTPATPPGNNLPVTPTSAPAPTAATEQASHVASLALKANQQSIAALHAMFEQTAQVHAQFLQGQQIAQQTIQRLVDQQHCLATGNPPVTIHSPAMTPAMSTSPQPIPAAKQAMAPIEQVGSMPTPTDVHAEPNATTSAATSATTSHTEVEAALIEVIAEKTGYPAEMLELDMNLDSDLGIDSIKRVEILFALQERLPNARTPKPEDIGSLQTLLQVVQFIAGKTSSSENEPQPKPAGTHTNQEAIHHSTLDRKVLIAEPIANDRSRHSVPFGSNSLLWITDDGTDLPTQLARTLGDRGINTQVVDIEHAPEADAVTGLVILSPAEPSPHFPVHAFKLIQHVGAALRQDVSARMGGILAGVSRLDGAFGLGQGDLASPVSGALAGLVKTAGCEWPSVQCKAIDLSGDWPDVSQPAEQIADELFLIGPAEVGLSPQGLCTLQLVKTPLGTPSAAMPIRPGDLVVVSGGGRGVTAQVVTLLAQTCNPTLLLLGRSPKPTANDFNLSHLTDPSQIKRALGEQLGASATPKTLEQAYQRLMGTREIKQTLERVEQAGAKVIYRSVDVRDATAVTQILDEARQAFGPVRVVIHGAGVLADRLIQDKTDEQFDRVYTTKVDGLAALLKATEQDELRALALFSSSTARFGRTGQADYAAANEVLNKIAQQEARRRPNCRVVSINWGPWDGGMVTPQLKTLFEQEGIGVIPLGAGARLLIDEICSPPGGPVEVVVLGDSKQAKQQATKTPSQRSGQAKSHRTTDSALQKTAPLAAPDPTAGLTFERELSIDTCPVLESHVIGGRAVLPMAVMIEWLAHGAIHDNPGLSFHGFDDLRVFKGVTIEPEQTVTVQVYAAAASIEDGCEIVTTELRQGDTLHARAKIVLTTKLPRAHSTITVTDLAPYPISLDQIYSEGHLFHGPEMHAIKKVQGWSEKGIIAQIKAASGPNKWFKRPMRTAWLADPLALDAAFQLMILWSQGRRDAGSLPTGAGRYRQFQRDYPTQGTRVVIQVDRHSEHEAIATIEFLDSNGGLIARMQDYTCVIDPSLNEAFLRNQLPQPVAQ